MTTTATSRISGNLYVEGYLGASQLVVPVGAVNNDSVAALAGIEASKLEHQHRCMYAQPNTTASAETKVVYVCYGTSGTIIDFRAGCISVCTGNATISVDLKKNGTSVLSSAISLTSSDSDRVPVAGTVATTSLSSNDVLEVVVTVNAGTGTLGTGVFAALTVHEDAQ